MNKRDKRAWLRALRSGEYQQYRGGLCRSYLSGDYFCCLGVLLDVTQEGDWVPREFMEGSSSIEWRFQLDGEPQAPSFWVPLEAYIPPLISHGETPKDDVLAGGITRAIARTLAEMNDRGESFLEIADWIEENL